MQRSLYNLINDNKILTHCNLSDGALADPRICRDIALFVRFELLDCMYGSFVVQALRLVNTAIGSRRDKT